MKWPLILVRWRQWNCSTSRATAWLPLIYSEGELTRVQFIHHWANAPKQRVGRSDKRSQLGQPPFKSEGITNAARVCASYLPEYKFRGIAIAFFPTCAAPPPVHCAFSTAQLLEQKIAVSVYFRQISPRLPRSCRRSIPPPHNHHHHPPSSHSPHLFQASELDISPSSPGTPAQNGVTGRAPL